ncbi:MAG TPA: SPW repeat protein [Vicinamibacterales bacterium]|nr:SPW repeat protein [Vicinamibacterales bacterium]
MKWSAWIAVLAGIGLLVAPFAAGYSTLSTVATAEAVVLGLLIAALALWAALGTDVPAYVDYLLMVGGAWSIVAPFVLAYADTTMARNSDVIAGIVVAAVAVYRAFLASPGVHRKVTA